MAKAKKAKPEKPLQYDPDGGDEPEAKKRKVKKASLPKKHSKKDTKPEVPEEPEEPEGKLFTHRLVHESFQIEYDREMLTYGAPCLLTASNEELHEFLGQDTDDDAESGNVVKCVREATDWDKAEKTKKETSKKDVVGFMQK